MYIRLFLNFWTANLGDNFRGTPLTVDPYFFLNHLSSINKALMGDLQSTIRIDCIMYRRIVYKTTFDRKIYFET